MKRFTGWLTIGAAVFALATPITASAHGHHGSAHHAADPMFRRGGGPGFRVHAVRTDFRHERVAHQHSATAGIHYRPVRTR